MKNGLKRAVLGALIGMIPGVLIIGTGLFIQEVLGRGGDGLGFFVIGVPLTMIGAILGLILGVVDPHSPSGQTTVGAITGMVAGGLVAAGIFFWFVEWSPELVSIWIGLILGGFFLGGGFGFWRGHHGPRAQAPQ
jgi:hypothetical protein